MRTRPSPQATCSTRRGLGGQGIGLGCVWGGVCGWVVVGGGASEPLGAWRGAVVTFGAAADEVMATAWMRQGLLGWPCTWPATTRGPMPAFA